MITLKQYFKRQYAFNAWANDKLIPQLEAYQLTSHPDIMKFLSHLLAAQETWISRIQGRPATINGVWEIYDIERCKVLAAQTASDWSSYIDILEPSEFTRIIAYKNTQGHYYETPIVDIMGHVVTHAAHHRAQIARMISTNGQKPLDLTFITYAREVQLDLGA